MDNEIKIGSRVKLLRLPESLIHDLPVDEQEEMKSYVGKEATIQDIDKFGYFWLGFGETVEDEQNSYYTGHSFCVLPEFIEIV